MHLPSRSLSNLTGTILSITCVIHCLMMPLVISSLPAWGLSWLARPGFHQALALIGIAIGVWTLVPGWKQHRRHIVLALGFGGLMVMNYVAFWGDDCCGQERLAGKGETEICTLACCKQNQTELSTGTQAFPKSNAAEAGYVEPSIASISGWSWLFQHPTAWGAALLAWAHCLNGACTKSCCNRDSTMLVTIGSATGESGSVKV